MLRGLGRVLVSVLLVAGLGPFGPGGHLAPPAAAQVATSSYLETFDSAAPGRRPQSFGRRDWFVMAMGLGNTRTLERQYNAHHSAADCAGYPAVHATGGAYEDAVFECNQHVMTSIQEGDYGLVTLTPPAMLDFSRGEAVLRWDVSTLRMSDRDWWDVWVVPYDAFEPLNGDNGVEPRHGIHINMQHTADHPLLHTYVVRDGVAEHIGHPWGEPGYSTFLPGMSAVRRDTFELRVSRSHVKFGMPAYNVWWADQAVADLGFDVGLVQIGHHAYNPDKACPGGTTDPNCGAGTWHWDNVSISPARPIFVARGDRLRVGRDTGLSATFDRPAPAGAQLRFVALGQGIEFSADGGATWTAAAEPRLNGAREHYSAYAAPVPPGTTSVQFRGQDESGELTILSPTIVAPAVGSDRPPATATPSPVGPVPTSPPTALAATPTPTGTATPRPTGTPTRTPAPAATRTPAATPATPVATATAAGPGATATVQATARPSFTSRASPSSSTATRGRSVLLEVLVTSATAGTWLVDVEIYDAGGRRVFQRGYDNETFRAGQTRRFHATWPVPSEGDPGTYTVKIGVFSPGWGTLYAWNDAAGSVTVKP